MKMKHKKFSWYLMVGEHCGKSTLLKHSGVSYSSPDVSNKTNYTDRIMNWWFFRNLCILNLSSNFLHESVSKRNALKRLSHWSVRLPKPAGIIISLSVTDIIRDDPNAVRIIVRKLRTSIEPILKRYSGHLPLHLMITQCDHFPGFSLWQQQLSPLQRQQALGYAWAEPIKISEENENVLNPLFSTLKNGLSEVRISMGAPEHLSKTDNLILLDFPESFIQLESGIRHFIGALCEPNVWYTQPTIQGVWFSSSEAVNEHRKSCFTHDLLKKHFFEFGQQQKKQSYLTEPWKKISYAFILSILVVWLITSAILSYRILKNNIVNLPQETLIPWIEDNEIFSFNRLMYLPFSSLIHEQQIYIESFLKRTTSSPKPLKITFDSFRQKTLSATPDIQRHYILQLANSLLLWKKMQDGTPLNELLQLPAVPNSLQLRTFHTSESPITKLALERYYLIQPEGKVWYEEAQKLLISLVTHDSSFAWLTAPGVDFPIVNPSYFGKVLSDSSTFSGVWTKDGEKSLRDMMSVIEQAAGQTFQQFESFLEQWPEARQNAWMEYITTIKNMLLNKSPTLITNRELIRMSQNHSQSMDFLSMVTDELSNIPETQAQPWLITLRQLQKLSLTGRIADIFSSVTRENQRLRNAFTQWLKPGQNSTPAPDWLMAKQAWTHWENVRNAFISEAISQSRPGDYLTRGLFQTNNKISDQSALKNLFPAFIHLQESLSSESNDAGTAVIWLMYKEDYFRLLSHAIAESACWLNEEWKSNVIWPLEQYGDKQNFEEQQIMAYHNVSNFIQGPASSFLTMSKIGTVAAEYAGMKLPFTDEFLQIVRHIATSEAQQDLPLRASTRENEQLAILKAQLSEIEKQQQALSKKNIKLTLTSLPVTIPELSTVMPTGATLNLNCQNNIQQLDSMNFAETKEFIWQPGQCEEVLLKVKFPNFSVQYSVKGADAWPVFIEKISSGQILISSNDFGDSATLLHSIGINNILVRFNISNPQLLNNTWKQWNENRNKADSINEQIISTDDNIRRIKEDNIWSITISDLPGNISKCQ
ncbi:type VI secretion system protein [Citrobacter cronae]|uniref:type VI secretion system protein n=1 Tax=Citrobacter cronae TaxID=1748967 RepID=UPI001C101CB9|nr:type VI secretion system protein [Citrobacter cronae]MBU5388684.1 hypothetical protein [Citrobacter cronae]